MLRPLGLAIALGLAGCVVAGAEKATGGASGLTLDELPIQLTDFTAGTFTQAIDHTPGGAAGTFAQRYWISTQLASGPNAPVILVFCGESACTTDYLTAMADTAKTLHAAVALLEHRYYGTSVPFTTATATARPTLAQMKYLTIHNALEDAAAFQAFATTTLGLGGKWIATGGSYPGMLAAFYRVKHPELVVGAWASSAPVNMQESFFGYDKIAADALGPACDALVRTAIQTVEDDVDDPVKWADFTERAWGETQQIPGDTDQAAIDQIKARAARWVSDAAMEAAQYGDQHALCSALMQHADSPVDGLIGYYDPPLVGDNASNPRTATPLGPGSLDASIVAGSATTTPDPNAPFRGGAWLYQQCTEVGFFKIPNPDRTETVMSDLVTADTARAQCLAAAGQTPAIAATRATYLDPIANGQATNIFFVNGSLDPWSALSFTGGAPAGITTKVVALGSHCTDWSNLTQGSTLGVFEAHKQFHDLAIAWLAQ